MARINAANEVEANVIDASQAEVALLYGREITALHADKRAATMDAFVIVGEAGAGDTASADVLRPSTDFSRAIARTGLHAAAAGVSNPRYAR